MKKLCIILGLLLCSQAVFADDTEAAAEMSSEAAPASANQAITAADNKVVITVQKCPLNENANQKIILKKNWFVVFVQVNGKVKVNPANVEVE